MTYNKNILEKENKKNKQSSKKQSVKMNKDFSSSFFLLYPDFLCPTTTSNETDSLIQPKSFTLKIKISPYNSAKKFKSSCDIRAQSDKNSSTSIFKVCSKQKSAT